MKLLLALIVGAFVVAPNMSFAKGDAKAGKAKSTSCAACHGSNGVSSNPLWPNLNGQKDQYLVKQLKDFKSGKRKDAMMAPMATSLSDADMANLAAYYSNLK